MCPVALNGRRRGASVGRVCSGGVMTVASGHIPPSAGQDLTKQKWIPAFAGMTMSWIPACAGMRKYESGFAMWTRGNDSDVDSRHRGNDNELVVGLENV